MTTFAKYFNDKFTTEEQRLFVDSAVEWAKDFLADYDTKDQSVKTTRLCEVAFLSACLMKVQADNDAMAAAMRRVPIARHSFEGLIGFACLGCRARSGIDASTGEQFDEPCKADCWVRGLEAVIPQAVTR